MGFAGSYSVKRFTIACLNYSERNDGKNIKLGTWQAKGAVVLWQHTPVGLFATTTSMARTSALYVTCRFGAMRNPTRPHVCVQLRGHHLNVWWPWPSIAINTFYTSEFPDCAVCVFALAWTCARPERPRARLQSPQTRCSRHLHSPSPSLPRPRLSAGGDSASRTPGTAWPAAGGRNRKPRLAHFARAQSEHVARQPRSRLASPETLVGERPGMYVCMYVTSWLRPALLFPWRKRTLLLEALAPLLTCVA